ncbi:Guanine nucleotide exchange factor lte1 [Rhodotorula toruloides]
MSAQGTRRRPGPLVQTSQDPTFDTRDLPDGSGMWACLGEGFAETTNEAAARALARFYAEKTRDGGETESVVQTRVDENGRTMYRVKPIADSPISPSSSSSAASSHIPFARPSHQPMPAATRPKIALYRSSLRQSRSIPVLRSTPLDAEPSPSPALLSPTAAAFQTTQTSAATTNRLRRIGSSPTLNSTPFARQSSHDHRNSSRSSSYEGDVLGRILGWREDVTLQQQPVLKTGTATKSRREGTARIGLPDLFRRKGSSAAGSSGGQRGRKGTALSTTETDTMDLPDDLEELDSAFDATRLDHPFASPPKRPSFARGPFGTGVRSPRAVSQVPLRGASWTTQGEASLPHPPHPMREVASNDSIRTARADDAQPLSQPPAPRLRYQDPTVFDVFHRPTGLSSPPLPPTDLPHNIPFGQHGRLPSSASLASARSSGSHASGQQITVVPAAGDDPRFVIWGMRNGLRQPIIPTSPPATSSRRGSAAPPVTPGKHGRRDSTADGARDQVGSPASSVTGSPAPSARQWSVSQRGSGPVSSPATSVRDSVGSAKNTPLPPGPSAQRILMAASVERLVAELTSQISSDLLTDFFLTYRHFVAPVDLLHLLISRFDWAMTPSTQPQGGLSSSTSSSSLAALAAEDNALRRVVRVRTFVVIRYWLLNHFMDDFFPSRELRTTLTVWLNDAARDERFRSSPKDARLIKGLKKTARKCKEAYILGATSAATATSRKSPALGGPEDELDLDLASVPVNGTSPARPHDLGGRTKTRLFATSLPSSPPRQHGSVDAPFPLPDSTLQNPIARSFSSAIGSIGRIKRKLGAATKGQTAQDLSGPRKGFEATGSEEGDLFRIEGGLEKYLEYWGIKRESDAGIDDQEVTPTLTSNASTFETDEVASPEPDVVHDPEQSPPEVAVDQSFGFGLGIAGVDQPTPIASTDYAFPPKPPPVPISAEPSYSANSTATVAAPLPSTVPDFILRPGAFGHVASFERPESVRIELDELDDSDEDEDVIEAKRTLKRLPAAQDLRFVAERPLHHAQLPPRQSVDSETSDLLRRSRRGPAAFDWTRDDQPRESVLFVDDEEGIEPGVATVPNFILEGLVDSDDEEPGDVEAALRRLEGLVDDSKEQEKSKRVAMQMEKSSRLEEERRRLAKAGEEEDGTEADAAVATPLFVPAIDEVAASAVRLPVTVNLPPPSSTAPAESRRIETFTGPPVDQAAPSALSTKHTSQLAAPEPPALRKPSISRIFGPFSTRPALRPTVSAAPAHRSFILFCKTETLAQQFALIERDMLRMLSYTELASGSWQDRIGETDVHDWEAYVKERRRGDLVAKEKGTQPSSAVQDAIARFNLTANWVCSEILLTASIDERAILLAKFIRLALKCYCMSNFQTLTQIVHGLQIPDVERLRKTWAKVPSWEMRKFRGMQVFVSHLKNFKYLRAVTNALVATEAGLPAARSGSFDSTAAAAAKGCIPFLGIFLRDLALNAELPTFLDPTNLDIPAEVDAAGSLISLANLSAFDAVLPLPPSISLAPLVNVHKFRVLAGTVRKVVAFQDLANRYTFEPTPNIYFKCLKIRSLEQDIMHELSRKLEA